MPCFSTSSGDSPVSRAVRSMLSLTCSIISLPRALRRRDAEWSERQRDLGDIGQ